MSKASCERLIRRAKTEERELTRDEKQYLDWYGYTGPGKELADAIRTMNKEVQKNDSGTTAIRPS